MLSCIHQTKLFQANCDGRMPKASGFIAATLKKRPFDFTQCTASSKSTMPALSIGDAMIRLTIILPSLALATYTVWMVAHGLAFYVQQLGLL
jgi:hypothetical protein